MKRLSFVASNHLARCRSSLVVRQLIRQRGNDTVNKVQEFVKMVLPTSYVNPKEAEKTREGPPHGHVLRVGGLAIDVKDPENMLTKAAVAAEEEVHGAVIVNTPSPIELRGQSESRTFSSMRASAGTMQGVGSNSQAKYSSAIRGVARRMDDDTELEQSDDQTGDWQEITQAQESSTITRTFVTTASPSSSGTAGGMSGSRSFSTLSSIYTPLLNVRSLGGHSLRQFSSQQTRSSRTQDEAGRMSEQPPVPGIGASNVYAMPGSLQDMAEAETKTGMGTNYTATQQAAPRMANKETIGEGSTRTSVSNKYNAEHGDQIRRESPAANQNVSGTGTAGMYSRRRFHTSTLC